MKGVGVVHHHRISYQPHPLPLFLNRVYTSLVPYSFLYVYDRTDHLVHRHTHRVTRGTLLVCGRPDGRLTALTSAECSVNLSVNQASSIQSLGGTCESITIGHNPAKLQLTRMDIALGTHRPKFLCEQILDAVDDETAMKQHALASKVNSGSDPDENRGFFRRLLRGRTSQKEGDDESARLDRSSHSLKGAYLGLREQASSRRLLDRAGSKRILDSNEDLNGDPDLPTHVPANEEMNKKDSILAALIAESKHTNEIRSIFSAIDVDGSGTIELAEFVLAYTKAHPGMSSDEVEVIFHEGKEACSVILARGKVVCITHLHSCICL